MIQFIQSHIESFTATISGAGAGVINGVMLFSELSGTSIVTTFILGLVGGVGGLTVRIIWKFLFPKKKKK